MFRKILVAHGVVDEEGYQLYISSLSFRLVLSPRRLGMND